MPRAGMEGRSLADSAVGGGITSELNRELEKGKVAADNNLARQLRK